MKLTLLVLLFFCLTRCRGQTVPPEDSTRLLTYHKLTDSAHNAAARGDKDTALRYHKKALAHARRHGLQEHEAHTLVHIAGLLKGEDNRESLAYLSSAMIIAEKLKKQDLKANIYLAMHGIYKQQQKYQEALSALEAHQRLLQDVFRKTRAQETVRLQAAEAQRRNARYYSLL